MGKMAVLVVVVEREASVKRRLGGHSRVSRSPRLRDALAGSRVPKLRTAALQGCARREEGGGGR